MERRRVRAPYYGGEGGVSGGVWGEGGGGRGEGGDVGGGGGGFGGGGEDGGMGKGCGEDGRGGGTLAAPAMAPLRASWPAASRSAVAALVSRRMSRGGGWGSQFYFGGLPMADLCCGPPADFDDACVIKEGYSE